MTTIVGQLTAALADRYRIERELGQGGMATVYLAEDVRHRRKVALKVLHPELSAVLGSERFLKEIELTASLQHPHILPLFDSGEAAGQLFYVMPFVEGETLRGRLERERQLPVEEALRIAGEVADALQYAHDRAVIHRDIKPENILLQGGHAVVADFGIALAVEQAGGQRMTQTGLSLGTPQYMAPEQAMGEKHIDGRADVYALGAVTYEMLAGEPPFTGPTSQAIVARLLTEPVRPITSSRPAVPAHVDAALRVALEQLPADRFAKVAEFSEALRGGPGGRASSLVTAATPSRRRDWRALIASGIAIAAVAGAAGWLLARAGSIDPSPSPPITVALAVPPVTDGSLLGVFPVSVSPDGSLMAILAPDSSNQMRLVVRALSGSLGVVAVPVNIATSPAFSPNAEQVAWFDPGILSIQTSDLKGGAARTVARARGIGGLTWLTDSSIVFSAGNGSLFRWTRGHDVVDTLLRGEGDSVQYYHPWSANDDLLVLGVGGNRADLELAVYSVSQRRLTRLGVRGLAPGWVDGRIITFMRDGTIWGVNVDRGSLRVRGSPRVIADGSGPGRTVTSYGVSRNGVLALRRGSVGDQRQLLLVDRSGTGRPVSNELRPYRSPRFSPDGQRIVYTLARTASTGGDVWAMNVSDGRRLRVTSDSVNLAPEWSSDGSAIMFSRLRRLTGEGVSRIDRISAQGSGEATSVLERVNQIYEFQFTPDGRRIVWREDAQATSRDIFMASLDSPTVARPLRATAFDERGVAVSPDGKWYLYSSTESGVSQVYVARLDGDGSRWAVSGEGGAEPRWAKNGEAFFRVGDSVFVTRIALGDTPRVDPPRALFGGAYMATGYEAVWDVSPDGKRFAMVRVHETGAINLELMVNWIPRWQAVTR